MAEDLRLNTNGIIETSEDTLWAENVMIELIMSLFSGAFKLKIEGCKSWEYSIVEYSKLF